MGDNTQLEGYKIAYSEGLRAIGQQQDALNELRNRTGVIMAAAAIVTAFLGDNALGGAPVLISLPVLLSFVLVWVFGLAVLWPTSPWYFRSAPKKVIEDYAEKPVDLMHIYKSLATHLGTNYEKNEKRYDGLTVHFRFAAFFLALEVLLCVIGIIFY